MSKFILHCRVAMEQQTVNLFQTCILVIKATEPVKLLLRQVKCHYGSHFIVQRQSHGYSYVLRSLLRTRGSLSHTAKGKNRVIKKGGP